MSTFIKTIKGFAESYKEENLAKRRTSKQKANLEITRFWGGSKKGVCLQLTVDHTENESPYRTSYIQLTKEDVNELIETLQKAFNEDIYPPE